MISLVHVFWMFIILFALIGAMRGWIKELIVSFSVVLALTFISLLENYVPYVQETLLQKATDLFWMRGLVIGILVFFGYQTPKIPRIAEKVYGGRIQDVLLGIFLGGINGYLISGSIWHFLADAGYPFPIISDPLVSGITEIVESTNLILGNLPPALLSVPAIYFIVVISFVIVLAVFI